MTTEQIAKIKSVMEYTATVVKKAVDMIARLIDVVRKAIHFFVQRFKPLYAHCVLVHGDRNQRLRARIFLRTRSKRIRDKQWSMIFPLMLQNHQIRL